MMADGKYRKIRRTAGGQTLVIDLLISRRRCYPGNVTRVTFEIETAASESRGGITRVSGEGTAAAKSITREA